MSTATDNFKTGVNTDITTKTAARSITPAIVGGKFAALADIVANIITGYDADIVAIEAEQTSQAASLAAIDALLGPVEGDGDTAVNKLREALVILQNFQEGADVAGMIANKVDKVTGKSLLSDSEITRLASLVNYVHPTGDGNLHVPATGTTNSGKVLTAGAAAGSLSWSTIAVAMANVSGLAAALALKADLVSGRLPVEQLPVTIPLSNIEEDDLTDAFATREVYEYDSGGGIFKIALEGIDNGLKFLQDMGVAIKGETYFTPFADSFGSSMSTGATRFAWVKINKQTTINEILFAVRTAGSFTASGNNVIGLYKVVNGTATLVRNTGNIATLLQSVGIKRAALTSAYTADPGYYLISIRYESSAQTTAPSLMAKSLDTSAIINFDGIKFGYTVNTDLPATLDVSLTSSVQAYATMNWFGWN